MVTLDGIIASLNGSYLATVNNCIMFRKSLVPREIDKFWLADRQELYLFRDQAYGAIKGVMSPFRGEVKLTRAKDTFNNRMSSI